jgi:hypothetical protein
MRLKLIHLDRENGKITDSKAAPVPSSASDDSSIKIGLITNNSILIVKRLMKSLIMK